MLDPQKNEEVQSLDFSNVLVLMNVENPEKIKLISLSGGQIDFDCLEKINENIKDKRKLVKKLLESNFLTDNNNFSIELIDN